MMMTTMMLLLGSRWESHSLGAGIQQCVGVLVPALRTSKSLQCADVAASWATGESGKGLPLAMAADAAVPVLSLSSPYGRRPRTKRPPLAFVYDGKRERSARRGRLRRSIELDHSHNRPFRSRSECCLRRRRQRRCYCACCKRSTTTAHRSKLLRLVVAAGSANRPGPVPRLLLSCRRIVAPAPLLE